MNITVAKSAGFCFGVNRAVNMVYELLERGENVCTLGPIIHNPQLVEQLSRRGVKIVNSPEEVPKGWTLVIRSHGVPYEVKKRLEDLQCQYADATCPFVAKIHRIVSEAQGKTVLIAGDSNHPEVQGIMGHCKGECFSFKNREELDKILKQNQNFKNQPLCVVAQTTFQLSEWKICLKNLKRVCTNATIFGTICNATAQRQSEAEELSRRMDAMIIIEDGKVPIQQSSGMCAKTIVLPIWWKRRTSCL